MEYPFNHSYSSIQVNNVLHSQPWWTWKSSYRPPIFIKKEPVVSDFFNHPYKKGISEGKRKGTSFSFWKTHLHNQEVED